MCLKLCVYNLRLSKCCSSEVSFDKSLSSAQEETVEIDTMKIAHINNMTNTLPRRKPKLSKMSYTITAFHVLYVHTSIFVILKFSLNL